MTPTLWVGNAQTLGARSEQQDAFGFTDKDDVKFVSHGGLAVVVADGMGGHAYGRESSQIAVNAFLQDYMAKPEEATIPDALFQAFHAANRAVCDFAKGTGEAGNCGTTLVAAVVHPSTLTLHWIGTGDSRLYLFRHPELIQMTMDTNYGNQLLSDQIKGLSLYGFFDAVADSQSLTSYLGLDPLEEIDRSLRGFTLKAGDWIMLCTDGVYNTLIENEMIDCLIDNPQSACESI
ncbi:MAG: PP2C family protein-serine/threonine phosphatase, partial [Candidatus Methylumidiphilus sp.]